MCIIAYKPADKRIEKETLRTCFQNNPDGAGYMFPCEERVLIRKGFFTFGDFWNAWEKTARIYGDSLPVVFHFRIATAGMVDKTNSHPHRIRHDLAFVHNGILDCVKVPKKSRISDTILYRDVYLRTMTAASLRESSLFLVMGDQIGKYNKFVFMNGRGDVAFANEDSGVWDGGVWYSNSTYLPRVIRGGKASQKGGSKTDTGLDGFHFCEYCGKDLDTPEERREGMCFACLDHDIFGYEECGGCDCALSDAAHRQAGWCDDCGREMYGDRWKERLDECEAEAATMEGSFDDL